MKKNLLYLLMLICSTSLFVACSDDDEPTIPIEKELAGAYKGTLDIAMNGVELANGLPKNVTLTKAGGVSDINLELKDFVFQGINLGDITIANCKVLQSNDQYTFSGNQELTLTAPIGKCNVAVNGTIVGGKLTVNLDIAVVSLNQTVKVTFKGAKLAGGESAEAKITDFIFDRKVAAVDSLVISVPVIDEANKTITFMVADTAKAEYLKVLVPTIVVSDKAVVTPGSNVAQDFNSPVIYTVIAENGVESKYTVSVSHTALAYDFEYWSNEGNMYPDIFNPIGWATCNDAVGLIKNMGPSFGGITYEGEYPVRATEDHVSGDKAVLMESVFTKGGSLLGQKIPKVTSGTAFLGKFNAFAALENPMATTSFGILYNKKPIEVTGYFKYVAGKEFYDGDDLKDQKDECALSVVLYEVEKEEDTLDGSTIYESDKIVASAMMTNGGTAEYSPFSLKLDYRKAYDKAKKYKLAVIFASSKEGAAYKGAVGSKLYIDNVTIINE